MYLALALACNLDVGLGDPDDDVPDAVRVHQTLAQVAAPAVDVLFVVDGTGSMGEEQAALESAAATFVGELSALEVDWQLGATSTDPEDGGVLYGSPWIVTPEADDPVAALQTALTVGSDHSPPSAGLDAATLALRDATGQNRGFRRDGAALHVVFVSDGEDQSGAVLGADPVGAFVDVLVGQAGEGGQPARASAVVGDAPAGCSGTTGDAGAGLRYLEVARRSGGAELSVCDADFGAVAARLGELAVAWPTRFLLQGVPVADSVQVTVDGARVTEFTVDYAAPAVEFGTAPAPEAAIVVSYLLAEEDA